MKPAVRPLLLLLIMTTAPALKAPACFAKGEVQSESGLAASQSDTDRVLVDLKHGNERFVSGQTRSDGQNKNDIARLATGQKPRAIVLSCSDSRVPPEAVFDQKLGEMFTVRSAGETLSPQAIGSIEFAIANLGSRLVVVLGHTNCGAVKAAIETKVGQSAGSENLDRLVADIRPRLGANPKDGKASKDLKLESWLNARGVAKDLLTRSSLLATAVASGKVAIKVGLYNLADGKVEFE